MRLNLLSLAIAQALGDRDKLIASYYHLLGYTYPPVSRK